MMTIYSVGLSLALLLSLPWWAFRMVTTGRYRAGLAERFGRLRTTLRDQNVIWVHAVSVGEVMAATELIRELRSRCRGWTVAVSTTTATGRAVAQAKFPGLPILFFPLDFAFAVRGTLDALQPRVLVLLESELWPRMLHECVRRGIPVVVANARLSDRSFVRATRFRRFWRCAFQGVTEFWAQGEETADRLRRLGVPPERVSVLGNLKFDLRTPADTAIVGEVRKRLPPGARVLVCGSTLEGEEAMLLRTWPEMAGQTHVMVLAPRHPERFASVERLVRDAGQTVVRASSLAASADVAIPPGSVVLLDTIGDLAAMYSIGAVAFVGGSLVPAGGHNPLEPARFAVPVTMGRFTENFREIVETMQANDAIRIVGADELCDVLGRALAGKPSLAAMGERGRTIVDANAGATERTVERLLRLLHSTRSKVLPR